MAEQLSFELPIIDRQSTKTAIEAIFEKYRLFLLTLPEDYMPKVTQTFSLVPTFSNQFHSSTEDSAVEIASRDQKKDPFIRKIQRCVNRLNLDERMVIIKSCMEEDKIMDYEVYRSLGMSERKYYRVKARAYYKLAFMLWQDKYI